MPTGPKSRADLFISFTVLALQGFGGVMAVAQQELVERKRWLTLEEFVEDWSVAQILPGPNVINLSVMIGARTFGPSGAIAAAAGLLVVPLFIVVAFAVFSANLGAAPAVSGAIRGMGAVAAALIAGTGLRMIAALRKNVMGPLACCFFGSLTVLAVAVLRLPLALSMAGVGLVACSWAYTQLAEFKEFEQ
jgi:chromate transporter